MNDRTLLILVGGGLALYWLTKPQTPAAVVRPPIGNPYNSVAGYQPTANGVRDPSDRNAWIPGLVGGLVGLGTGIANAVAQSSGSTTSSGYYQGGSTYGGNTVDYGVQADPVSTGDWSDPFSSTRFA